MDRIGGKKYFAKRLVRRERIRDLKDMCFSKRAVCLGSFFVFRLRIQVSRGPMELPCSHRNIEFLQNRESLLNAILGVVPVQRGHCDPRIQFPTEPLQGWIIS